MKYFKRLAKHSPDKENSASSQLVTLSEAHTQSDVVGHKAARLGQLINAGYKVPDGFVVTLPGSANRNNPPAGAWLTKNDVRELNRLWKKYQFTQVAVRSSGQHEDLARSSLAGLHDTVLDVLKDNLEESITRVGQSLGCAQPDTSLEKINDETTASHAGGVIVQRMIDAEFSGVLFTEHPDSTGAMMVEIMSAQTEQSTHCTQTPETYVFGKLSGDPIQEQSGASEPSPIDLSGLLTIGRELELLFDNAQDIEWAYSQGTFHILQSRDITRSISHGNSLKNLAESERRKLLKNLLSDNNDQIDVNAIAYTQNTTTQLLPRPTPVSLDLMQRLYSVGGSTDLACKALGIPYVVHTHSMPLLTTVFGWNYLNCIEHKQRLGKGPGSIASLKLLRQAQATKTRYTEEFLPAFQSEMIERNAIATNMLTLEAATSLLGVWVERFIEKTYVECEKVRVSADIYQDHAVRKLEAARLDPALYINEHHPDAVSQAMSVLDSEGRTSDAMQEFLLSCAHRAEHDFELSEARYGEDATLIPQQASQTDSGWHACELPKNTRLKINVRRAREFIQLTHEARHFCLIELAQIRRLLMAIDFKLQLDGRLFQLTIDEIGLLGDPLERSRLLEIADQRFELSMIWKALKLPATLSIHDLERINLQTGAHPVSLPSSTLGGKRVSGDQEIVGTVRIISNIDQIDCVQADEILVADNTDRTWYPFFAQARGIITQTGGWLSHTAIVAREYNLPAIVGVRQACATFNNGDVIRMNLSGSIDLISERRTASVRLPAAGPDSANDGSVVASDNDEQNEHISIYQLTTRKLFRFSQNIERRSLKACETDRRQQPRYNENGELQKDRRLSKRLANAEKLRSNNG